MSALTVSSILIAIAVIIYVYWHYNTPEKVAARRKLASEKKRTELGTQISHAYKNLIHKSNVELKLVAVGNYAHEDDLVSIRDYPGTYLSPKKLEELDTYREARFIFVEGPNKLPEVVIRPKGEGYNVTTRAFIAAFDYHEYSVAF